MTKLPVDGHVWIDTSVYADVNVEDILNVLNSIDPDDKAVDLLLVTKYQEDIPYIKRFLKHQLGTPSSWATFNYMYYSLNAMSIHIYSLDIQPSVVKIKEMSDRGIVPLYVSRNSEKCLGESAMPALWQECQLTLSDVVSYMHPDMSEDEEA